MTDKECTGFYRFVPTLSSVLPSPFLVIPASLTWPTLSKVDQTAGYCIPLLMPVPHLELPSLHHYILRFYSSFIFLHWKTATLQNCQANQIYQYLYSKATMAFGVPFYHTVYFNMYSSCPIKGYLIIETYQHLTISFKISVNICIYNVICTYYNHSGFSFYRG